MKGLLKIVIGTGMIVGTGIVFHTVDVTDNLNGACQTDIAENVYAENGSWRNCFDHSSSGKPLLQQCYNGSWQECIEYDMNEPLENFIADNTEDLDQITEEDREELNQLLDDELNW